MTEGVTVAFPVEEGVELRASFFNGGARGGRAEITIDEAVAIGTRLADVLFPKAVFRLFAERLGKVVGRPNTGLRIRLDMDASLVDLPWEYVRRRDREGAGLMSGFLLLDRSISMVRQRGDANIAIEAIKGRQSLSFVGTMWETGGDVWQVKREFGLLCQALKPIVDFIEPKFATATKATAFEPERQAAAIFHYSGHCYFDDDGRPYLAREVPKSGYARIERKFYVEALAPALAAAGTRLAVMSACNSGFWTAVKPLLDAGLPAVVGVNGAVLSHSAIEFCAKLYESLAVGLTLDEAAGRARLHIMKWGRSRDLFDWGLYMVYMPSREPRLFQRATTRAVALRQKSIRQDHLSAACETQKLARKLDGMDFGEIMSELSRRRVLILGRFSERRLAVLESIKAHLKAHPNKYIPELFTFEKPESTSLTEAIIGFAALSRFIIADLSEPRSVRTPGDRAEFPVRSGGAFDQPDRQGVCALYQPADLQERCESHGALARSGRLAGEDGPAGRASGGEETLKDLSRERKVVIRPGCLDAGGGRGISAATRRPKSSQFEEPPRSRVRAPGSASDLSAAASNAAAALWKDAGRGAGHGLQTLDAAASSHAQ